MPIFGRYDCRISHAFTDEHEPRYSGEPGEEVDRTDFLFREDKIQDIAKESTHRQSHLWPAESYGVAVESPRPPSYDPLNFEPNSQLDPHSPKFEPRAWTQAIHYLNHQDPLYPSRKAGIAFRNLNVFGSSSDANYQKSVGHVIHELFDWLKDVCRVSRKEERQILRDFEGIVNAGELLVVLGPPGSGCSTFLRTVAGETEGLRVCSSTEMNYQGLSRKDMKSRYRGEAIYTAEIDEHFPEMTVGDTLYFSARARMSRNIPLGYTRDSWARLMRDTIMATFGIAHCVDTKVGNDFIRGVSGGERKRVTIAEAASGGAAIQCWDNSTRGLDSANAIKFCQNLRTSADYLDTAALVAIYQAPQAAYDQFDKVLLIYEGRQIFFGPANLAKTYFINLGFVCADRQTTADFLTSMTSPQERIVRKSYKDQAPRTPDEFAQAWQRSLPRRYLMDDIDRFMAKFPFNDTAGAEFEQSRSVQKSKYQLASSSYTLSYGQQVTLCLWRGFRRLLGDPSLLIAELVGNLILALVVASVYFNLPDTTKSFFSKGALLFFTVLLNAFGTLLEIVMLYAQRPIVEKHARYAYYHPSAEAIASAIVGLPYKILNTIIFNIPIYFMANFRREPAAFFYFLLISFFLTLAMSMLFRTIASVSRTMSQAMTPAAILILGIVAYTGFAIPVHSMLGWSRWINYLNPVAYGFEALMSNEFHDRNFTCANLIPSYGNIAEGTQSCNVVGSVAGFAAVEGSRYLDISFGYDYSRRWWNLFILIIFCIGLGSCYVAAAEWIGSKKSKGEVLVFRRGRKPKRSAKTINDIEESSHHPSHGEVVEIGKETFSLVRMAKRTNIFHWSDISYNVKVQGKNLKILDEVNGWVKPGTLTALMGVSGAGKTTLLDVLASRVNVDVISGIKSIDGQHCDESFQRRTGYVQQQDLHLSTATVREALTFSALLRQSSDILKADKLAYVEEVISMLDMQEFADAIVGVPGEGLNVEQRKRLTIGIELAAKPDLLLFLDEPTSGLDSQTSWAIINLLEKLAGAGQAILCTVHQPSAILFQRFDRLLLLAAGGKTVYFGDIGHNSKTLIRYFEKNKGLRCPKNANPAEWMLQVIGASPGSSTQQDWSLVWKMSEEHQIMKDELALMQSNGAVHLLTNLDTKEYAAPLLTQFYIATKRVFELYWRTPSYLFSKFALCFLASLFIGFTFFDSANTQQGIQNQLFAIFLLLTLLGQISEQMMPLFVHQRDLFESRERASKTFSWVIFLGSNILVEIFWNTIMSIIMFTAFFYPIGFWHNMSSDLHPRSTLFFLFILQLMLFISTFTSLVIAGFKTIENAANVVTVGVILCIIFCGILAPFDLIPKYWKWMYYASPVTYLVEGLFATGVAHSPARCAPDEVLRFSAPVGLNCGEYMDFWISQHGGYLLDAMSQTCAYCQISSTDAVLAQLGMQYEHRWRNFGILWGFIAFNIVAAFGVYWLAYVPKRRRSGL